LALAKTADLVRTKYENNFAPSLTGTVGEDEAITEANGLKVHATPLVDMKSLNNGDFTFEKADAKQAE
jgi:hypothetical protein